MTRHGAAPVALRALVAGPVLLLVALLAGCGSAPGTVDPSGVDGLVVPSPTPDPDDFVAGIDNPWLPLGAGAVREYEVVSDEGAVVRTDTVATSTHEIGGVATTPVTSVVVDASGERVEETVSWFAQDDEGNVWAFGVEGSWQVGTDGAGATLAMPAHPRLGDGYVSGRASGVEQVDRVGEPGSSVSVPAGRFTELVHIRTHPVDDPDEETQVYFARGVGEVLRIGAGGSSRTELVRHTPAG